MNCLRCGYCCIKSAVVIVDNPELGPIEGNIVLKEDDTCKHLVGDKAGEYACSIHDYPWYKDTPCYAHGQIEHKPSDCRMGVFIIDRQIEKEKITQ